MSIIYLCDDDTANVRLDWDNAADLWSCGDPPKSGPLVILVSGPKRSPDHERLETNTSPGPV
jgi:hypothetical protein